MTKGIPLEAQTDILSDSVFRKNYAVGRFLTFGASINRLIVNKTMRTMALPSANNILPIAKQILSLRSYTYYI